MIRKLRRALKFFNPNCRRLEMIQTRGKQDKGNRVQLRKGVKMKTEEYNNLVLCRAATELTKKSLFGCLKFLCVMTCVERDWSCFPFSLGWNCNLVCGVRRISNSRNFVFLKNQGHQMLCLKVYSIWRVGLGQKMPIMGNYDCSGSSATISTSQSYPLFWSPDHLWQQLLGLPIHKS